jgi:ribosomal protein S18 acetylase RimI-like enzyme
MGFLNLISRLSSYYRRHGFWATLRRGRLAAKRFLFASRMAVFYCDLDKQCLRSVSVSRPFKVERLRSLAELNSERLHTMTSFWNPKLANRNIRERFEKGASLWVVEFECQLAGYGWTLQGRTIAPYYFPLGPDDVHFFDFHVFPGYRGRGINPYLIGHILEAFAVKSAGRAFIEAATWNDAQLSSLRRTPFRRLGSVRSFTILGRTVVSWARNKPVAQALQGAEPSDRILRMAREKS